MSEYIDYMGRTPHNNVYILVRDLVCQLLPVYLAKLDISDWRVDVRVEEIADDTCDAAKIYWDNVPKNATLVFDSQQTWTDGPAPMGSYSVQHILAHELVHLVMAEARLDQFLKVLNSTGALSDTAANALAEVLDWAIDEIAVRLVRSGTLPMSVESK